MIRVLCDHCGKGIANSIHNDSVKNVKVVENYISAFKETTYGLELCEECFDKFKKEWLENDEN